MSFPILANYVCYSVGLNLPIKLILAAILASIGVVIFLETFIAVRATSLTTSLALRGVLLANLVSAPVAYLAARLLAIFLYAIFSGVLIVCLPSHAAASALNTLPVVSSDVLFFILFYVFACAVENPICSRVWKITDSERRRAVGRANLYSTAFLFAVCLPFDVWLCSAILPLTGF